MSYQYTDIILCYPGIGRTFFEQGKSEDTGVKHSSFTINFDVFKTEELLRAMLSKQYRYLLAPINPGLIKELKTKGIPFLLVSPNPDDMQIWIKRWLKAGATAGMISERINDWGSIGTPYVIGIAWIYLTADEWLGNILQQTPLSEADGKDV